MKNLKFFAFLILTILSISLVGCKKNVKITFDTGGGTSVAAIEIKKGSDVLKPEVVPTKNNAIFAFWELNGQKVDFPIKNVDKSLTIKAAWKYKVAFDVDGGSPVADVFVLQNTTLDSSIKSTNSNPEKHFVRWNYGEVPVDENFKITQSVTLKAVWGHKLSFLNDSDEEVFQLYVAHDEKIKQIPTMTKEEFVLIGWRNLDGELLTQETQITEDTIFHPVWGKKITFDVNGGNSIDPIAYEYNSNVTQLPTPIHPNGRTFVHWEIEGVKVEVPFLLNDNVTLKAVWGYKVSYETGFEDIEVETEVHEENHKFLKPENIYKADYTFVGWMLDGSEPTYPIVINKDIKLVAKWNANIVFDVDGGNHLDDMVYTVGSQVTELPTPVKANVTFVNWDNKKTNSPIQLPFTFTEKIELKAVWKVTLSFNTNGGSEIQSVTVKSNQKINDILKEAKSTKENKTLFSWKVNDVEVSNVPLFINDNTEAKAVWGYKVTFDVSGGNPIAPKVFRETKMLNENDLPKAEKEGKIFSHWEKEGVKVVFPINFSTNTNLKAVWGVALNLYNKSNEIFQTIGYAPNDLVVLVNLPELPQVNNHRFYGWAETQGATEKIDQNFNITTDKNLYPIYEVEVNLMYDTTYVEGLEKYFVIENKVTIKELYDEIKNNSLLTIKSGKYGSVLYNKYYYSANETHVYDGNLKVNESNLENYSIYLKFNREIHIHYNIYVEDKGIQSHGYFQKSENSTEFYSVLLEKVKKLSIQLGYFYDENDLKQYENKKMKEITGDKDYFAIHYKKVYKYIVKFTDLTNYALFSQSSDQLKIKNKLVDSNKTKFTTIPNEKYINDSNDITKLIKRLNSIANEKGLKLESSRIVGVPNQGTFINNETKFNESSLNQTVEFKLKVHKTVNIAPQNSTEKIHENINVFGYNKFKDVLKFDFIDTNSTYSFYRTKNNIEIIVTSDDTIIDYTLDTISIFGFVKLKVQYYKQQGTDYQSAEFIYKHDGKLITFGTKFKNLNYTYLNSKIDENISDTFSQYSFYQWEIGELAPVLHGGSDLATNSNKVIFNNDIISATYLS